MTNREKRYINTSFEVRELDDSGTFTGYASTFNNKFPIWLGMNETVRKGAFAKTLSENLGQVPILHNHDSGEQIGWGIDASEDNKGLLVEARLDIDHNPRAKSQWALMQMAKGLKRAKMGLSIGFYVHDEEVRKKKGEPDLRIIKEAQLFEYSVTPFPANPKAGVTQVRNINDYMDSLDKLSIEERSLLMTRLNELLKADLPQEPKENSLHSISESLEKVLQNLKSR